MNNKETMAHINRLLHKRMGLCYHEPKIPVSRDQETGQQYWECRHRCGQIWLGPFDAPRRHEFTTDWQAWGEILLPWAMKQDWWTEFLDYLYRNALAINTGHETFMNLHLVNPASFCKVLNQFLSEKGDHSDCTMKAHDLQDGDVINDAAYPEGKMRILSKKSDGHILELQVEFTDGEYKGNQKKILVGANAGIAIEEA